MPVTDITPKKTQAHEVNTDARPHTRLGWMIILLGVGGFFIWAGFAPLDKGVPLSGTVTVSGNKKVVQHLTGGIVEAILVKDGDPVNAGDVLVKMNAVQAKMNADIARGQYFSTRATESRLVAERDGKTSLSTIPDLQQNSDDPRVINNISLQAQLLSSRQSALRSGLSAFDENIAGLLLQGKGLEESRDGKKAQLNLLKEQLSGIRDLANDGYVPRNRLLELERTHVQLLTAIAEDINSLARIQRQIAEVKSRRLQSLQEYQKEVRSQLSDARKEADSLASRLTGLDYELANVLVKAPVGGTVASMSVFTHGGVVPPGFRMMDIVPVDEPLIIEGQLPVHLVDKVRPDLKVDLIFSAFNQNTTPVIPGLVTQVSADRLVEEKTGQPFYAVKVKVAPQGVKMLAKLQIRPGMPVDLFVKTGERTMLNYLVKPLLDHLKMAMTEE